MCGIFAAFSKSGFSRLDAERILEQMSRRGPDAEGLVMLPGIVLGHRRLAILDLDNRSTQPMHSICGRYLIVFNGEIYNFQFLKKELEIKGYIFRTNSDTEVILNLYIEYGEKMLKKLLGMFTIIIWDNMTSSSFIARDPYGIKPLYYMHLSDGILFASQVKALACIKNVGLEIDEFARAYFFMLGSVPEPRTWFKNIKMVSAGSFMRVCDSKIIQNCIWCDIGDFWRNNDNQPIIKNQNQLCEKVRSALLETISRHLESDVPIAVLLSGGIDSGAIVALIRELDSEREIIGITVTYDEFLGTDDDETLPARIIANTYNIKHHIVKVTEKDFKDDLSSIMSAMDQPSVDGINTWYATREASKLGIKVVLSGVGGDELFFGYPSFRLLPKIVNFYASFEKIPYFNYFAQHILNLIAFKTGNSRWLHLLDWVKSIGGAWWLRRSIFTPNDAFKYIGLNGEDRNFIVRDEIYFMAGKHPNNVLGLAQIESKSYLRNQLLRDADWASMYHGVELRTPLVDIKLLITLSPYLKSLSRYGNKIILAKTPKKKLPEEIVNRKKTGFGIPVIKWINNIYMNKIQDRYLLMKYIDKNFINTI